jgi:hypothetical protein
MLRQILREEIAAGRVVYHAAAKRYEIVRSAFERGVLDGLRLLGDGDVTRTRP